MYIAASINLAGRRKKNWLDKCLNWPDNCPVTNMVPLETCILLSFPPRDFPKPIFFPQCNATLVFVGNGMLLLSDRRQGCMQKFFRGGKGRSLCEVLHPTLAALEGAFVDYSILSLAPGPDGLPLPTPLKKPQLLLFSATVPSWVRQTADRYMTKDKVVVDLIGKQTLRTAVTVEHKAICCPYSERPDTIADIIQVCLCVW